VSTGISKEDMSKPQKTTMEKAQDFMIDFALGGFSGAIAKTITAPIERVKLIIQTQDANPRIISGEVKRYTGIINCFVRVSSEQGLLAFWRGNFTNVIRYFPTQAFNFAFKDFFKSLFPSYSSKTQFLQFVMVQVASGSLAGAGSLCIVYPLDYARTRLASDVGTGKRDFNGLWDCLKKNFFRTKRTNCSLQRFWSFSYWYYSVQRSLFWYV
jgi:solute carrier family 25 (adenine nucleotide translocator) protein 4/5/6/31